ncbi:MAG TPA: hypothetical protein ENJ32_05695 [Crenotrichaceae bacterium]|nr:hypothetical protein [Crenotrichaceae bacterium]
MPRLFHHRQILFILIFQMYSAHAAIIQVNTTVPETISDGLCSLTEAITAANTDTSVDACPAGHGADIIQLEQTTYTLTSVNNVNQGANGLPVITTNITIQGIDTRSPGTPQIETVIMRDPGEIEGGNFSPPVPDEQPVIIRNPAPPMRLLRVSNTGELVLKNLIMSDGLLEGASQSDFMLTSGGCVLNQGSLKIEHVIARKNNATDGGAIYSSGELTITDNSIISNNRSTRNGGAIHASNTTRISKTKIINNTSGHNGGAIYVTSGTTLSETEIINNHTGISFSLEGVIQPGSGNGGAIAGSGNLTIQRSKISDNSATDGGAIRYSGSNKQNSSLAIYNSVLERNAVFDSEQSALTTTQEVNSAIISVDALTNLKLLHVNLIDLQSGAGLKAENSLTEKKSDILIANSIISGTNQAPDCLFSRDQHEVKTTNNWFGDNSCNGQATLGFTHLAPDGIPKPNSLLIDAADNILCADPLIGHIDLRGMPRPVDGDGVSGANCDIGAFERQTSTVLFGDNNNSGGLFFIRTYQINHKPKSVTVQDLFADLGFASTPSFNGVQPGIIRLSKIFPVFPCTGFSCFPSPESQPGSKFTLRFQEYNYLDKIHQNELVSYLGASNGIQRKNNGEVIIIDHFELSGLGKWKTIQIPPTTEPPHVFLSIQTANGGDAVTVRVRNVTNHSFEAALFKEEALSHSGHVKEKIGYLAFYHPENKGTVTIEDQEITYFLDQIEVNHQWTPVFDRQIKLQEEQSADNELFHLRETVDVLLLGEHLFTQIVTNRGRDTVSVRQLQGENSM